MERKRCRISVLGIKGGVGKSTISLSLGMFLARNSKKVLLIDRDILGFASYLSGIRGKGLLSKVIDDEEDYWNCLASLSFGDGKLTIIKLFGDGYRLDEDLEKVHSNNLLREKFSKLYKSFLTADDYDYFIVDNPQGVLTNNPLVMHELEVFYSVINDIENLRVYVTNYSINTIATTIKYAKSVEKDIKYRGFPLAFIVNLVPSNLDDLENAKTYAIKGQEEIGAKFSVVIPIYPDLLNFARPINEIPEIKEINEFGNKLLSGDLTVSGPISYDNNIEWILNDENSVLIFGPAGSGKLALTLKLIKIAEKDKKVVIVSTNNKLENFLRENKFMNFTFIHIAQKYNEDRFNAKNIGEILKISKKLSTEILKEIKDFDKSLIIIYRANDLSPASNCCDTIAEKQEFWSSLISTIKFKKNTNLVLICDKIGEECNVLSSLVDVIVETNNDGKYKIERNIA
ncbi:AAA family ATPase [Acidianus sp. HS-5]|uniref:nucleotide-binding protein n=1 Tax=Acidianus sp. HS-5 TaxID=2886040 RepID=UPI001F3302DC|nr:AAA family ATPase [Acidianus sp. HS-5]BDC18488.1 hypothetical protein HS5_13780 [Acidianus sp. HS-5]